MAPISFHHLTREGETVFHLTVKYKHYESFIWLAGAFHNTDLFHRPDQCGNTLLHLAVSRGCDQVMNSHILIFELVMVTIFNFFFFFFFFFKNQWLQNLNEHATFQYRWSKENLGSDIY